MKIRDGKYFVTAYKKTLHYMIGELKYFRMKNQLHLCRIERFIGRREVKPISSALIPEGKALEGGSK